VQNDIFAIKLKKRVSIANLITEFLHPIREGNIVRYKAVTNKNFPVA